ncbi:MAG: PAS domain S-box protein [Planctomycetota bacterium]
MSSKEPDNTSRGSFRSADGQQWFHILFEQAPLCVFEEDFSDDRPRIIRANQRAVETYGWSRRELLDLDPHELIPDCAAKDFAQITEAVRSGRAVTLESHNRRRDGTVFPVRVSASPTTEPSRALVMAQDVSEHRQADATLRALLNATHERAVLLETDGTIVDLNLQAARALGGTPEELKGRMIRDFFPEELTRLRRQYSQAVIRTGRPQRWEDVRDGRALENSIYPVFDEQGNVTRLAGFARDVTEHRQAQAALRQAKQRLQRIVDNTWDVIFQMDLSGNYTFGNKAASRVTGYRLDQLMQMNLSQVVAPEYVSAVRRRLQARIEGRPLPQPFSFEVVRADGRRVPLELSTTGVYEEGKLTGVQGVARDVTERRRAERALQHAHHKLLTAREDERRRVARELHDSVGQQLAAMRLLLQSALKQCDAGETETAHEHLARASNTCNALVGEVRDICQGLYPATLESLGLPAALRELCSRCGNDAHKCCCEFNIPTEDVRFPPEVEIALYRVAQEALSNALCHAEANNVRFELDKDQARVTLRVSDDGKGFDPAKVSGHGLGISSMTDRVEAVGGALEINSRPGHTEIVACVPLEKEPSE